MNPSPDPPWLLSHFLVPLAVIASNSRRNMLRSLTCPLCRVAIDVPPPPRMTTEPTSPASSPPPSSQSAIQTRIEKPSPPAPAPSLPPRKAPPVASPPSQVKPDSDSSSVTPDPAADSESSLPAQIAVLTPEIKADLVQSARELIAEESCWIAKLAGDGRYVTQPRMWTAKSSSARQQSGSHAFRLFGAVLRELEARNVTPPLRPPRVAGRELEAAIQEICPTTEADAGKPEERARRFRMPSVSLCWRRCARVMCGNRKPPKPR